MRPTARKLPVLAKCPTGIRGLDEITTGGLPRGRTTLVCGGPGCGKTLLAMEFLMRGIRDFGENGAFMSFEETEPELAQNVASLGYDLDGMIKSRRLAIDHVRVERREIEETGEYDLEGLFVRLGNLVQRTGAKRVAIDSIEALFAGLPNEAILRSELRRLFQWLKSKGLTAIVTGEQGVGSLTRHGLEEYISDCVIFLDHRVSNQIATRRLRVVKYRGSPHATNEYPTMIDEHGLSVMPISSAGLDYEVGTKRVSTGVARLDAMLGGRGYYRGSSVLITGSAGSGKTSLATAFAAATCRAGRRCLYVAYEESPPQLIRNMGSIGYDLKSPADKGLLRFHAVRSTLYGLEQHLVRLHNLVQDFRPAAVVVDPISNLTTVGRGEDIKAMVTRLIDVLKSQGTTALFTSLSPGGSMAMEQSEVGISSLMDTWLLLRNTETGGERNRLVFILKSRGMAHSNQVREFTLSEKGIDLTDVYLGPSVVLTGTARLAQEARDQAEASVRRQDVARKRRELDQERLVLKAQIESLLAKDRVLAADIRTLERDEESQTETLVRDRTRMARARRAD